MTQRAAAGPSEKTFGPAPSHEVAWCVTHRFVGERKLVRAQTAFFAVARAGWTFSEASAVRVDKEEK
jgi:hypothetical protein